MSVPSGRTRTIPPPRRLNTAIGPSLSETEIPHGDIDPAIDTHTYAVGRMVCSSLGNVIGTDALDQALLINHAVAVGVLVQGEEGRVHDPEFAVVGNQSARMIHLGKGVHLVRFAITVGINAAYYATTAFFFTKTPLLIDANKHFADEAAVGNGVINFRRCNKRFTSNPSGAFTPFIPFMESLLPFSAAYHLARQFGREAGMRLKFHKLPHTSVLDPWKVILKNFAPFASTLWGVICLTSLFD